VFIRGSFRVLRVLRDSVVISPFFLAPLMSPESRLTAKLAELGIPLPPAAEPKGVYKPLVVVNDVVYTSGHLPIDATGKLITGRLGADLDVQAGYRAAQLAGLGILASLRKALGSLDSVRRVVKILGVVNGTPELTQQPAVLNGCSELFAEVFGPESGIGARSAVGVNSLPLGVPVEIEAIFQIEGPR
jgi:enamine deaminase RidA (YjgF/YER057c/UK114 family)